MVNETLMAGISRGGVCEEKMLFKIGKALLAVVVAFAIFYEPQQDNRVKIKPLVRTERVHIVRYGENVFNIADKYFAQQEGTKDYARFVFSIRHENGMLEGRRIAPGDKIIIPLMVEAK
ncbi:MAG: hypothetical protein IKL58_00270 [Phascolarctobacterium sp.]|nr:hypothetical protein [Phascolarctobacterium sp.]